MPPEPPGHYLIAPDGVSVRGMIRFAFEAFGQSVRCFVCSRVARGDEPERLEWRVTSLLPRGFTRMMNFPAAVAVLFDAYTHDDLAMNLDTSHVHIRQALLDPTVVGYRRPPAGWNEVLARLARQRAERLLLLAEHLGVDG